MAPLSRHIFLHVIFPIVTFVPLSVVFFLLLFSRLGRPGLFKPNEHCPSPAELHDDKLSFQLQYLGGYVPPLEGVLCQMVAFFHPILQSEVTPSVVDILASFAVCVVIPFLEAARTKRHVALAFPATMGMAYVVLSGGFVYPIYWAILLATTGTTRNAANIITQAEAEAVLFAFGLGYVLPTLLMVAAPTPRIIAYWQAYPMLMGLLLQVFLWLSPRRVHGAPGHRTVQATYVLTFLCAALVHLSTCATNADGFAGAWHSLLPSLATPSADTGATSLTSVMDFFQWDFVTIFGSTFVASLWFVESVVQGVALVLWSILGSAVLGPGAAIAGIFFWRESRLNRARLDDAKNAKAL